MFNQKTKRKDEPGKQIKTKQNCTDTDSECERIETKLLLSIYRKEKGKEKKNKDANSILDKSLY